MIVKTEVLPGYTKVDRSEQRKLVHRDVEEGLSNGYNLFELIDDSYEYDNLTGSAENEINKMICEKYLYPMWASREAELNKELEVSSGFKLSTASAHRIARKYFKVHGIYDPELKHKRIFVQLSISEERINEDLDYEKKLVESRYKERMLRKMRLRF